MPSPMKLKQYSVMDSKAPGNSNIQEPMTSWGVLIQDGAKAMEVSPWMLLFPGALLSITLYCFNFIGDGMRDALDPKER